MSDKQLNTLMGKMIERGKDSQIDPEALKILEDVVGHEPDQSPEKLPRSPEKRAELEQLPLWPMATRGVPNSILRSSLFGVVKKGRRNHCYEIEVPSSGSLKVIYTGMRLDQADLDVWEQCLSLAKENGLGTRIWFSANSFLKAIGRPVGNSQHLWLKKALKRLGAAQVEIIEGDRSYFGTLIQDGFRDEKTDQYIIKLNPQLSKLYGANHWTRIQWDERHTLNKKYLAQWLHGFYSSHKEPYPMKVEKIRELCGSETKDLSKFRQSLRKALKQVQGVTGWQCWIDDTDKVNVARHRK